MNPRSLPEDFLQPLARAGDQLGVFAHRQFLWYETVPSTNDLAAALAERGAREGCAVVAEAQSAGRGRHGRRWSSPPGAGLYLSTILRPPAHALGVLTIAAGVAVAEAIQSATGLDPGLKWPNDVFVDQRKVAGVLAEAGSLEEGAEGEDPHLRFVVLGIGINVMPASHPPDVASRATSIEEEVGRAVDRGLLLSECLVRLATRYQELRDGERENVLEAWRRRARTTLGRTVEFDTGGRRGVTEGIDESGALLVRTESGLQRVISGEVRWI